MDFTCRIQKAGTGSASASKFNAQLCVVRSAAPVLFMRLLLAFVTDWNETETRIICDCYTHAPRGKTRSQSAFLPEREKPVSVACFRKPRLLFQQTAHFLREILEIAAKKLSHALIIYYLHFYINKASMTSNGFLSIDITNKY